MFKPIYNKQEHVLCYCLDCGRLNYVEPHGTTAKCACSDEWTEHKNIPSEYRDISHTRYIGPKRILCTCGEGDVPGLAHCEGCMKYNP